VAAWLTVYCTRSVARITASDLVAALGAADLHMSAEAFGIDDESVVDDALAQLRIESIAGLADVRFRLTYAADNRPVLIHLCDDPVEELEEALEEVQDERVRACVQQAVEVVMVELRPSQLEDMGIILAEQVAETFASAGRGLVRDENDDWWAVEHGVLVLVLRSSGDA
jgi:hypothetical protein